MRRPSRKVVLGLAALIAAVAIPVAIFQYRSYSAGIELAEVIADLDRNAPGWRLADIEARLPHIPDERNSAIVIKKARLPSPMKALPVIEDFKLMPNQVLNPHQQTKLREYLDIYAENLEEARKLVDLPEGRFQVSVAADFISTSLPHVDHLFGINNVLLHDACWQVQQGDFERAAKSCQAAVHASRSLKTDPFCVSHTIRLAAVRAVAASVERMLAQGEPPLQILPPLQRLFQEEADFNGWRIALEGERAGMHELLQKIEAGKVDLRWVRALSGYRRPDWRDHIMDQFLSVNTERSHAWLLRQFTDALGTVDLPPQERLTKLKELNRNIDQAPELAKMLVGHLLNNGHFVHLFQRSEVKFRCTAAGLAAEQFRRQHQRWSKTLDELVPGFLAKHPLDPYTGKSLQLRATPDGIVIYSTGRDNAFAGTGRDDPEVGNVGEQVDHEFRLWNVDRRRVN